MRLVKVGIGTVNPTVGAFFANAELIAEQAEQLANEGCHIASFGEQCLQGYGAEDLVQWNGFVSQQFAALMTLACMSLEGRFGDMALVVGLTVAYEGNLYNCAAIIYGGEVLGIVPKENLPDYRIFYEGRTMTAGHAGLSGEFHGIPFGDMIFEFGFGKVALEVCEDIWINDGPMPRRSYSGAELVINISASPYRRGVVQTRREMVTQRAADNLTTVMYTNLLGGQDALVFDGGGFVNQAGRMLLEVPRYTPGIMTQVIDLDRTSRLRQENSTWRHHCQDYLATNEPVRCIQNDKTLNLKSDNELVYPVPENKSFFLPGSDKNESVRDRFFLDLQEACMLGLEDYFKKTGAFKRFVIALSGGKDSCITLVMTCRLVRRWGIEKGLSGDELMRFIADHVWCYSMPSHFNGDTTKSISRVLCEELGATLFEVSIQDAFEREVLALTDSLPKEHVITPITFQNIQARIRGMRMWNIANSVGGLWIQTGNMSEKAVGYTTIGGDMMGAYSMIANMPKTVVIEWLLWANEGDDQLEGLTMLNATVASAELAEDQNDEDDLMPFEILDACFPLFVGEKMMPREVYLTIRGMWTDDELREIYPKYEVGMLKMWVKRFIRLFVNSIFKWVQCPLSVHLGALDLDRERALQLPVMQSKAWLRLSDLDGLPE